VHWLTHTITELGIGHYHCSSTPRGHQFSFSRFSGGNVYLVIRRGAAAVVLTRDDCAISVRFHGYCKGTARQPCDNRARAVRMSHDSTIAVRFVFDNKSTENRAFAARSQCGVRTTPVRGLCSGRNDMSIRATGLRFLKKNLYNFILHIIVEAAMPVNLCENLKTVACLRTGRPNGKGDTGSLRAPWTHRKPM